MKKSHFTSLYLSLGLLISLTGCGRHNANSSTITQAGPGVGGGGVNATSQPSGTANPTSCDTVTAANKALVAQSTVGTVDPTSIVLAPINVGPGNSAKIQLIFTYTVTTAVTTTTTSAPPSAPAPSAVTQYLTSMLFDQTACTVTAYSTGALTPTITPDGACNYDDLVSKEDHYKNRAGNPAFTETLLKSYIFSDPKNPQGSPYTGRFQKPVVEFYRQSSPTSADFLLIDPTACKVLYSNFDIPLETPANVIIPPPPTTTTTVAPPPQPVVQQHPIQRPANPIKTPVQTPNIRKPK